MSRLRAMFLVGCMLMLATTDELISLARVALATKRVALIQPLSHFD